jgi:hypothetical protein
MIHPPPLIPNATSMQTIDIYLAHYEPTLSTRILQCLMYGESYTEDMYSWCNELMKYLRILSKLRLKNKKAPVNLLKNGLHIGRIENISIEANDIYNHPLPKHKCYKPNPNSLEVKYLFVLEKLCELIHTPTLDVEQVIDVFTQALTDNLRWKLYLDDLRTPPDESFIVARTMEEAQKLIETSGMPIFISFDHDLGTDDQGNLLPTGYDFVKWLVEMDMDEIIMIPAGFTFDVHSQNPVGARNIQSYLSAYMAQKRGK